MDARAPAASVDQRDDVRTGWEADINQNTTKPVSGSMGGRRTLLLDGQAVHFYERLLVPTIARAELGGSPSHHEGCYQGNLD